MIILLWGDEEGGRAGGGEFDAADREEAIERSGGTPDMAIDRLLWRPDKDGRDVRKTPPAPGKCGRWPAARRETWFPACGLIFWSLRFLLYTPISKSIQLITKYVM